MVVEGFFFSNLLDVFFCFLLFFVGSGVLFFGCGRSFFSNLGWLDIRSEEFLPIKWGLSRERKKVSKSMRNFMMNFWETAERGTKIHLRLVGG